MMLSIDKSRWFGRANLGKKKASDETFKIVLFFSIHPRSKDNLRQLDNQAKFLPSIRRSLLHPL